VGHSLRNTCSTLQHDFLCKGTFQTGLLYRNDAATVSQLSGDGTGHLSLRLLPHGTLQHHSLTSHHNRFPLPAVSCRLQAQVRSCGICGGQSGTGAGFLRVLPFPLPIIPLSAPHSSSIIIMVSRIGQMVAVVPSGLSLTAHEGTKTSLGHTSSPHTPTMMCHRDMFCSNKQHYNNLLSSTNSQKCVTPPPDGYHLAFLNLKISKVTGKKILGRLQVLSNSCQTGQQTVLLSC
jgi:hypothetical protein